jgi:hypothetical protein
VSEQHTDPEYADPMAGTGISEDNYDEPSWADENTPLDDPEADRLTEDDHVRDTPHGYAEDSPKLGPTETVYEKPSESWRYYWPLVNRAWDELTADRPDLHIAQQQRDSVHPQQIAEAKDALRELTWKLTREPPYLYLENVFPTDFKTDVDPRLYPLLYQRAVNKEWDRAQTEALVEELKERVGPIVKKLYGEERRGGAREQGVPGKAKKVYPHDHLGGPIHYSDFTTRQHGKGGARRDTRAAREWLEARLVEDDDRRWIAEFEAGPFSLEDYKRALAPGRKDSQGAQAIRSELAIRLKELKGDGCYMTTVAKVLGVNVKTIKRMVGRV